MMAFCNKGILGVNENLNNPELSKLIRLVQIKSNFNTSFIVNRQLDG